MTNDDLTTTIQQLVTSESDSEIIITGAALLDQHLQNLLEVCLIGSVNEIRSLTRSAAQRRILAQAIGLIAQAEAYDLKIISRIRNTAAHEIPAVSFADSRVTGPMGCLNLFHPLRDQGLDLRSVYIKAVFVLASRLNNRLASAKRIKAVRSD